MGPYTDDRDDEPRLSQDSLSSVSTTSLVFERLQEASEKASGSKKGSKKAGFADLAGDDTVKDEDDAETGPFLGHRDSTPTHRRADKGMKRICIILCVASLVLWAATAVVFLASGSYKHDSDSDHDPDANHRGSGKAVTLDQVLKRFWSPSFQYISWIPSPDGQDGLLLERGAEGKDYLVVEDVRSKEPSAAGGAKADILETRTLMQNAFFEFNGRSFSPDWLEPSPDLGKILIAVNKVSNWRHSFKARYFIYDVKSKIAEALIPNDEGTNVQLATWSPTSDAIAFTLDNNLYIRRLGGENDVVQITKDGGPEYFYGIPDWVYEEEVFASNSATWWSDDGQYIAFLRTNETGVPEYPIQYFVSRPTGDIPAEGEEPYPDVRRIKYPKAGSHNPVVNIGYYDVAKAEVFSIPIDDEFAADNRIINGLMWAGSKALLKETNRNSDILKTTLVDVESRHGKTISTVDIGKIDGGWFEISHKMTYIPADAANGREDDGYVDTIIYEDRDHLAYFTPIDNPEPAVMLTSGPWEVEDAPAAVDLANNLVYFIGTRESSIQRHVYSVKLDGSGLKPLTDISSDGYYDASFSSGASYALLTYKGPKIPFQKVISTPSSKSSFDHMLEDNASLGDRAKKHELPILKYGTLDLGNDVTVNYLERRPPHFNPKKQYPILFQQYSGPGSQTVNKKFAVDFQSYVASALGYLVITVDPRGTGFRGRKHRVAVRGHLGVLEAEDHIAAAKHFASLPYVDESRLAMWGWSYGGFQTLKTLEQDAGRTYSYGMAVAPVTDWRFYDSIYTDRYMRTPQENQEGYDATKVSNATALGMNTRFLIMHGSGDDNVHFQNSLTLLDELDLAGVENYDVHVFPDSDHGIYFHNANRIVYDKLSNWLINAFNGEWLKVANPKPNPPSKRTVVEST